jgi:hypothetical protein
MGINFKMKRSDVVFMYKAKDLSHYINYKATALAWGGAHTQKQVKELEDIDIHATGTMWCLTAGAKELHNDPDLMDATVKDIEGNKIIVPWLHDFVFEGTPSFWSCTNHPAFRAHMRKNVCTAMAGGAFGLHVDDHLGTASPAVWHGGCFCDYCMDLFEKYLIENETSELLKKAGVSTFKGLNYKEYSLKYATTKEEYLKVMHSIPLYKDFCDFQLMLAAKNVGDMRTLAENIVNRPVTLSANAGLPSEPHMVVTPDLSYLICEIEHFANTGRDGFSSPVKGYIVADIIKKPVASTGCGWDNAYVKANNAVNLMKTWISIAYACGQHFMAPDSAWCYTKELGSHMYYGEAEVYTPMYCFIQDNKNLFDGFEMVGPIKVTKEMPKRFDIWDDREMITKAVDEAFERLQKCDKIWLFPRENPDGRGILHLVNTDYTIEGDTVTPCENITVTLPQNTYSKKYNTAEYYTYEGIKCSLPLVYSDEKIEINISKINIWGIIELK